MVNPKFSLAITATPYRKDNFDKILEVYFGPVIVRYRLYRPYNSYIYYTKFKPKKRINKNGGLDWNEILKSISENERRNKQIAKVSRYFYDKNILILTKRISQSKKIRDLILKKNPKEDIDVYTGSMKSYRSESRILISTYSKSGVGFDHPKLDMLIVACDVENLIEQYEKRIMRKDNEAVIIDFCDDFSPLYKHLNSRILNYYNTGAEVNNFKKSFPFFRYFK